jgi:hypothetical protein
MEMDSIDEDSGLEENQNLLVRESNNNMNLIDHRQSRFEK